MPNGISSIVDIGLTDIEIGELLKTKSIHLDGTQFEIRLNFPAEEDSNRLVFRESWVFAKHLCQKRVPSSSFLMMDEEKIVCRIFKETNFIGISIRSSITGDMVYSGPLIRLVNDLDVDQAMEHVDELLTWIAKDRFASDTSISRILSYDIVLQKVNELIIESV